MAAVPGGFSSGGSTNTRRAGHLLPLPCNTEPAAASCASSGSSPARSKATRAATSFGADSKLNPEVEATGGSSPRYGSRPPPSDRAGSLTHPSPATPSSCIRRGGGYRQTHGGEDASSSVTRRLEKGQGTTIRLQTTRHPSLLDRSGSVNDSRFSKSRGNENEVCDKNNWQTDTVSSCISSARDQNSESDGAFHMLQNIRIQTPRHRCLLDRRVEGSNQAHPRSIHEAVPARLMHQGPPHNCHQHMDAVDPINDSIVPEVSGNGAFVGRKHRANLVEPSAMPRNIRLQIPRNPSLLSWRGCSSDNNHQHVEALDTIDEWRLHKEKGQGRLPTRADFMKPSSTLQTIRLQTTRHPSLLDRSGAVSDRRLPKARGKGNEGCAVTTSPASYSSRSSRVHFMGDKAIGASTTCVSGNATGIWEDKAYTNTLSPGGGYGYPHPPPFYRCKVCSIRPALYRLSCCMLVVCEHCNCGNCKPAGGQTVKKELPKVKLEGSDLFLWQQCSFPEDLMLCKAKRTGDHLKYYFADIQQLMNPEGEDIRVNVYDFGQQGRNVISLAVGDELLKRKELR